MIKILHKEGRYAPVLVCDHCGKRIESYRDGMEVSAASLGTPDGEMAPAYHVHTGACDRAFEAKHGGEAGFGSEHLDVHFANLVHNLQLKPDDLSRAAALQDKLSF